MRQLEISHAAIKSTAARVNRLHHSDREVHDWYRFVLSFPAHLVRDYLERFSVGPKQTVLDPFSGTGTTLVECKKLGIPSICVEANPMATFASRVKTNWEIDPDALIKHSTRIAELANKRLDMGSASVSPKNGRIVATKGSLTSFLTLSDETLKLLLKNSISPLPLHKTIVLSSCIDKLQDPRFYDIQRLALAREAVATASNLRFGPEVGLGKIKQDAPMIEAWANSIRLFAEDLRSVSRGKQSKSVVIQADARDIGSVLQPNSIDAVITSPPYPNEKDYSRTTRLESVLLGFLNTKADLRTVKKGFVRSNTRSVYKGDADDEFVRNNPRIQAIAERIERTRRELGKTSGFEKLYSKVTTLYFGGMARHLTALAPALRRGAQLAYVVGDQASYFRVKISTGELLAEIAESIGYKVQGIDLFRTRAATATKDELREEVVVLKWV